MASWIVFRRAASMPEWSIRWQANGIEGQAHYGRRLGAERDLSCSRTLSHPARTCLLEAALVRTSGTMTMTSVATTIEGSTTSLKRGLAWASLAGIGGCAAACSLPMLAAGLFGGGAFATAIARLVTPGAELIAGGLAFLVVLGVVGLRVISNRRRAPEPIRAAPILALAISSNAKVTTNRSCGC